VLGVAEDKSAAQGQEQGEEPSTRLNNSDAALADAPFDTAYSSTSSSSSLHPTPNTQHPRSARKRRVSTICTDFEDEARAGGFELIAGVDEVGRGALAGPVVAAAVILDPRAPLPEGLDDSKKLTALQRERIADEILRTALAVAVGQIESDEIDEINILQATRRAMLVAIEQLDPAPHFLLIDAVQLKECALPQKSIIHGDAISSSIAAASVLAKCYRDALMRGFHDFYPQYNFVQHVGYGTRAHYAALRTHGACTIHRKSFRGVL
jgi:ribonuclease HII